jgi:hypothetical protein
VSLVKKLPHTLQFLVWDPGACHLGFRFSGTSPVPHGEARILPYDYRMAMHSSQHSSNVTTNSEVLTAPVIKERPTTVGRLLQCTGRLRFLKETIRTDSE